MQKMCFPLTKRKKPRMLSHPGRGIADGYRPCKICNPDSN